MIMIDNDDYDDINVTRFWLIMITNVRLLLTNWTMILMII